MPCREEALCPPACSAIGQNFPLGSCDCRVEIINVGLGRLPRLDRNVPRLKPCSIGSGLDFSEGGLTGIFIVGAIAYHGRETRCFEFSKLGCCNLRANRKIRRDVSKVLQLFILFLIWILTCRLLKKERELIAR